MQTKNQEKLSGLLEAIRNDALTTKPEMRFVRTCEIGDEIRQGDIAIYPVADNHEHGKETGETQLAPGTTKGSRHVVNGDVRVYAPAKTGPLVGPVLVAGERFTITHPEHADVSLPSGTYEVTYQRDMEREEIRRVAD